MMRFYRRVLTILLLPFLFSQAAAQSGTSIFAPFVSRLTAEVSGRTVRLTWLDAPSVKGPVYVYRAQVPFSGTGMRNQAEGREVPYGQQTFVEDVETFGVWYYFVAASDETRLKYEMVVPYNNIIDIQLDGSARQFPASPGTAAANTGAAAAAPSSGRAVISPQPAETPAWDSPYGTAPQDGTPRNSGDIASIAAQALPDGIHISFSSPDRNKNALLYRSSIPVTRFNDILSAVLVKDRLASPYVDYPPPGTVCYYAILYEEDLRSGQAAIYPGGNATVIPVYPGIAGQGAPGGAGASAFAPLPATGQQSAYLDPGAGYFSTVRSLSRLSAEAAKVAEFVRNQPRPAPVIPQSPARTWLEPRVFNQDLQPNAAPGEDYDLAQIVRGPFFRKDWKTARFALERYLSAAHSQNAVTRARFYLGQCCYFLGDARAALNEFTAVHTMYPEEAASWLQAALAKTGERRQ
jgi:hypothetical protein